MSTADAPRPITDKLNIFDVLSLRDTTKMYKQCKMVQFVNGSFPFPCLIHVHHKCKQSSTCFLILFPTHPCFIDLLEEIHLSQSPMQLNIATRSLPTSEMTLAMMWHLEVKFQKRQMSHYEPFNTLNEMFMTNDASKLCCRIYSNDIESGALEDHPDIICTFLSKHFNQLPF